ncbi:MAG: hypothetical protein JW944_09850 [Deltaproteobacteria bacterium]|nr:hypothetical protein [Deltaproteobacteria bacterium]
MLDLALIVIITGIGMFVSCSLSDNITWFDYYKGGVFGLFLGGVIIHLLNISRKKQEMKNKKSIYEIEKEKIDQ